MGFSVILFFMESIKLNRPDRVLLKELRDELEKLNQNLEAMNQ